MGRPKAEPYTLGSITFRTGRVAGQVQARGLYRDRNGRRIDVTASGRSKSAAERALRAKVRDAETAHRGGDRVLNESTTMRDAVALWLDSKRRERLAPASIAVYEAHSRVVIGSEIAYLTVAQANSVSVIESFLETVADQRGSGTAKGVRKVLSGTLGLAERRGAIVSSCVLRARTPKAAPGTTGDRKCHDPECDQDCGKSHADTHRAFTAEEVGRVMAAAEAHGGDIADLCAFLFGTGVRISEALHHTAWADIDWQAGTVRVRGTKTRSADRVLRLSPDLLGRLRVRRDLHGDVGQVFGITHIANRLGEPRDRRNVGRTVSAVLDAAGCGWAGSHTFRRTVASWMDAAGVPLAEIANQLGHSNVTVTAGYLGRRVAPTRAAEVMVLPAPSRPVLVAV